MKAEQKPEGRLEFAARAGHSLDLEKIHACIGETRLSGKKGSTGCQFRYLEITAVGELEKGEKGLLLKVNGTKQVFRLDEEPGPKAVTLEGTVFERLQRAMARGEKITSVSGRVKGWTGHAPKVLKEFPADTINPGPPVPLPPLVYVTDFEIAKQ